MDRRLPPSAGGDRPNRTSASNDGGRRGQISPLVPQNDVTPQQPGTEVVLRGRRQVVSHTDSASHHRGQSDTRESPEDRAALTYRRIELLVDHLEAQSIVTTPENWGRDGGDLAVLGAEIRSHRLTTLERGDIKEFTRKITAPVSSTHFRRHPMKGRYGG